MKDFTIERSGASQIVKSVIDQLGGNILCPCPCYPRNGGLPSGEEKLKIDKRIPPLPHARSSGDFILRYTFVIVIT